MEPPALGDMTFEFETRAQFLADDDRREFEAASFEKLAPAIRFVEGQSLLQYAFELQSLQSAIAMALLPDESSSFARSALGLPLIVGSAEIRIFPKPPIFRRSSSVNRIGGVERILSFHSGNSRVMLLSLEHIAEFGSRHEKRKGIIRASAPLLLVLAGAGAGAMGSAHYAEWHQNRQIERSIEQEVAGSRCQTDLKFTINYGGIQQRAVTTLDWREANASKAERDKRTCRTQLLLRLAGHPPGPIDGDWRARSQAAWNNFVQEHGIDEMRREEQLEKLAIEAARNLRIG